MIDHEGEKLEGFEPALKLMETNGDLYKEQDKEALKTFFEIQSGQLRMLRYSWNQDDKSIPSGWRSRRTGNKTFFLSPSGEQFPSRVAILQNLLKEEEVVVEEVHEMIKLVIDHEGWRRSEYLPTNWIFKVIWGFGATGREASMNLKILSNEGHILTSYSTAKAYIESRQIYSREDVCNIDQLATENAKERRLQDTRRAPSFTEAKIKTTKTWENAQGLPLGWKIKKNEKPLYLSPDGRQLSGLPNVLTEVTSKTGVDSAEAELVRGALVEEGWRKHELLPKGWMIKASETKLKRGARLKKTNLGIISPEGHLFSSFLSAACYMEEKRLFYSLADIKNIKSIDIRNGVPSFEEQEWGDDGSLPQGWKVKLSMEGGVLCEAFLTPDNSQLASRHSALEHLISTGGTDEEVAMMRRGLKKFGWEEEVNLPIGWLKKEGMITTRFLSPCNKKVEGLPALLDFLLTQKADFQVQNVINFQMRSGE